MQILPKNVFIQNLDASLLQENFLTASIVTIFIIRGFLKLTDYPQLSGAGLHVAHLLWGGLFMLVALLLMYAFLSRTATNIASVLGGVGFGAFIDELGKFITSDNNYFFQPTVAILYVLFVLLYIFSKLLAQRSTVTEDEYLVNALDVVKEAVINDLDSEEKNRALMYLSRGNSSDKLVKKLTAYLSEVESIPVAKTSLLTRIRHEIARLYTITTQSQLLSRSLVLILGAQVFITAGVIIGIYLTQGKLSFAEWGQLISSLLSALMLSAGIILIKRNQILAYRLFKADILTSLFITQFFLFYREQFMALIGLGVNVILLAVVDYALKREVKEGRY